jgi:RecB family exonuclease
LARIQEKEQGWMTPSILGFNRWVKNAYESLWEPRRLLSRIAGLTLWDEAVRGTGLPEGLRPGPYLYLDLQDSFDILMRSGQLLTGPPSGHALADWRRVVFGKFLSLVEKDKYIPWGSVLKKVGEGVAEGRIGLPERIILAGFNELSPAEEVFVRFLALRSKVTIYCASNRVHKGTKVRLFATPEQECQAVCAEVLRAWNLGQKRLGVVFLDQDYFGLLKQSFEELADREERPPHGLRYNLARGTELSKHPLFQTALLPLRIPDEPQPNRFLSSLLFSPYVRRFEEEHDLAIRSFLWDQKGPKEWTDALYGLSRRGLTVEPLKNLCLYKRKPFKAWLYELENLWRDLGFPLCRCETDVLAKDHLSTIVVDLKKEAGNLEMSRGDVLAWMTAASRGIEVVEKTPETAGIQVLNLEESRGLGFDFLWVVGTHGRALPRPAGESVFLDSDELRNAEGGTAEKTWEAGQRNLSSLLAGAPVVMFSRAASKGEDAPYLPCPLIPIELDEESPEYTVDLWKEPPAEWLRARWLREGLRGLQGGPEDSVGKGLEIVDSVFPGILRVTEFEELLLCPFRFFAGKLLGLKPLEEPKPGIDPRERGEVLHKILREFVRGFAHGVNGWPEDQSKAFELLERTVDAVLGDRMEDPFWRVERLRLLGDGKIPGLLKAWLDAEQKRASEGWRFEAAEISFEGLPVEGTPVKLNGRVDRIDFHPEKGRALWDYKTGDPDPSAEVVRWMVRPQLPAYLLALKNGLLSRLGAWSGETEAGYIGLKRASEVKISSLEGLREDDFFKRWIETVKERLEQPLKGIYSPDPRPQPSSNRNEGACKYCPFLMLCGYHEKGGEEKSRHG